MSADSHHGRSHSDHARVSAINYREVSKAKKAEKDKSGIEEEFIREQKQLHEQGAILNAVCHNPTTLHYWFLTISQAHLSRDGDAERQHNLRSLEKLGDPLGSKSVTDAKQALRVCTYTTAHDVFVVEIVSVL